MAAAALARLPLKLRLALALVVSYSAQSLLITASKAKGSDFGYSANSVVLLSEAIKLCFAVGMVTRQRMWAEVLGQPWWLSLCSGIPGLLYALQNNLVFFTLLHMDPGLFQLLNTSKILTTGLTFRLLVGQELRLIQWLALVLLSLGMMVTVDLREPPPLPPAQEFSLPERSIAKGLAAMACMSVSSALASVTNEVLIKGSASVYVANVWLYSYGVAGCMLYTLVTSGAEGLLPGRLLSGFSGLTYAVVLCSAFMGQSIAFIFRYADVIVKIYATAASVAFTTMASWALFDVPPTPGFLVGYLICVCSICMYYLEADVLYSSDAELVRRACGRSAKHD